MKRIFTLAAVLLISIPAVFAQEKQDKKDDGWKDKVKAEKIAFITNDLELTSEEAQDFWPIYNKYSQLNAEANKTVREAHKALCEAVEAGSGVEAKLDAYAAAVDSQKSNMADAVKEYKKVISVEKVAKLYISEEKFRFQQIEKLHRGGNERGPQPRGGHNGERPEGAPQPQPSQQAQQ